MGLVVEVSVEVSSAQIGHSRLLVDLVVPLVAVVTVVVAAFDLSGFSGQLG